MLSGNVALAALQIQDEIKNIKGENEISERNYFSVNRVQCSW